MSEDHPSETASERLFVVMGVAGSGKSTIGASVAARLGATYFDGDDLHPAANIAKMKRGIPLDDSDRWPWLEAIARQMSAHPGVVFAGCSALKRSYRDFLADKAGEVITFIYLAGSKELIARRMGSRSGHFMPLSLLESQFATLEPPTDQENAITIDISGPESEVIEQIIAKLGIGTASG